MERAAEEGACGGARPGAAAPPPSVNGVSPTERREERLGTLDASFLYLERPSQVMHVAAMITFDGVLDYERLLQDLSARLHLVPRYTQRVMSVPLSVAHPTWERDPQFDIRAHVHSRRLQPPGTDVELAELCSALYGPPLDRAQPLWEMYLINGYSGGGAQGPEPSASRPAASAGAPRDRSVLFVKTHHCMVDGVSGIELLRILLDVAPEPPPPVGPVSPAAPCRPLPGRSSRFVDGCWDRIRKMLPRGLAALPALMEPRRARQEVGKTIEALVHVARTFLEGVPRTPLNGRLGSARALSWLTVPLGDVRAIKNELSGSINDVVLAVVSGALRRLLAERGMNPDRVELRALVPVSVRGVHEQTALGNRISMMVVPLPIGIQDPVERLRQVRVAMVDLKTGNGPAKVERIMPFVDMLPPQMHGLVSWMQERVRLINTICTNVPGPPIPLYLQGVRVGGIVPFVPLVEDVGVAFAVLSYCDAFTFGVTANPGLVPELTAVVAALRASMEDLLVAAPPDRRRRATAPARLQNPDVLPNESVAVAVTM
jgi:WS/DGAT/MGAT family acyltransferase